MYNNRKLLKSSTTVMCISKMTFFPLASLAFGRMARGHQKIQSQAKNAKKQAEMKKAKGHDQKAAAKAALVFTCLVCRVSMKSHLSQPRS